jgi:hypothetical protein
MSVIDIDDEFLDRQTAMDIIDSEMLAELDMEDQPYFRVDDDAGQSLGDILAEALDRHEKETEEQAAAHRSSSDKMDTPEKVRDHVIGQIPPYALSWFDAIRWPSYKFGNANANGFLFSNGTHYQLVYKSIKSVGGIVKKLNKERHCIVLGRVTVNPAMVEIAIVPNLNHFSTVNSPVLEEDHIYHSACPSCANVMSFAMASNKMKTKEPQDAHMCEHCGDLAKVWPGKEAMNFDVWKEAATLERSTLDRLKAQKKNMLEAQARFVQIKKNGWWKFRPVGDPPRLLFEDARANLQKASCAYNKTLHEARTLGYEIPNARGR